MIVSFQALASSAGKHSYEQVQAAFDAHDNGDQSGVLAIIGSARLADRLENFALAAQSIIRHCDLELLQRDDQELTKTLAARTDRCFLEKPKT